VRRPLSRAAVGFRAVIRGVLTPAAVALLGRWNWWLPNWAARILRVEPSPCPPKPDSQPAPQPG
jgi:RND superfamily putative drug exporter